MPGRTFEGTGYRYGYGSHEKDNEIKGSGNHLSFGDYGYDTRLGRRWNIDPMASKYPGIAPYSFCFNNPIIYKDPDGQDGVLIVFPDYKVDPELKVSVWGKNFQAPKLPLGHAGVLLIDNKTGLTKYYEFGRYPTTDGTKGRVRSIPVPNVVIGKDGQPTQESLNKVLGVISQKSGHGGRIEGAYIESDNFKEMNDYAQQKMNESNVGNKEYNKDREPYDLYNNNCGTFGCDVLKQDPSVKEKAPSVFNPTPTNVVEEYQDEFIPLKYDPATKTTTIKREESKQE